jgi:hypothetical protein
MKLRKYDGEAEGWLVAVAKRSGTGWDDDDQPFQVVKDETYYIDGDFDPAIFKVDGGKKKKPDPVDIFVDEEKEVE